MDVVFESKNILYVRPSFDLIPDYLEMVNDIEHVVRFIGEHREPYTEEEERSYMHNKGYGTEASLLWTPGESVPLEALAGHPHRRQGF